MSLPSTCRASSRLSSYGSNVFWTNCTRVGFTLVFIHRVTVLHKLCVVCSRGLNPDNFVILCCFYCTIHCRYCCNKMRRMMSNYGPVMTGRELYFLSKITLHRSFVFHIQASNQPLNQICWFTNDNIIVNYNQVWEELSYQRAAWNWTFLFLIFKPQDQCRIPLVSPHLS